MSKEKTCKTCKHWKNNQSELDYATHNGICTCCPNIIFENGEMIVIHMAFDGRHLVEEVNEILNNPQKQKQWEIVKTI